jgi:hypothetical protein
MLNAWGEPRIKQFVQESISHAIRLEQALVKLQTEHRIVVLHGITEGKTATGISVYNVSAPALQKTGKPYRIVEL